MGDGGNLSNCKITFTGQKKISRILAAAKPGNSHVKHIIINHYAPNFVYL